MIQCRVCHSHHLEEFLDLTDQPHCNSLISAENLHKEEPLYPLIVYFCHDCTTVQIGYTVPKEEMFSHYVYVSGTTRTLREHFQKSADRLVKLNNLKEGDYVVDIGSNDGTWLSCYKHYKLNTIGVEPATNIAKIANDQDIFTINDFFNESVANKIIKDFGRPKLVTAAGVFFHLEELHSVTQGVANLIDKEGVFCVQAIYLGEILRHNEFDNIYHEHLTYWTLRSIQALFTQYDLEVFHVDLLTIHGGSLELFIAKKNTRPIDSSVHKLQKEEEELGYDKIEIYKAFAQRVQSIKERLLSILKEYKEKNVTVYAFGAPAKGATTLNSFGITHNLVPIAVERNPLKIGKTIPKARIPIIDEAEAEIPDAFLILPWNFLLEFLEKKKDYIMNGGIFIVPIPEPYVITKENYDDSLKKLKDK